MDSLNRSAEALRHPKPYTGSTPNPTPALPRILHRLYPQTLYWLELLTLELLVAKGFLVVGWLRSVLGHLLLGILLLGGATLQRCDKAPGKSPALAAEVLLAGSREINSSSH